MKSLKWLAPLLLLLGVAGWAAVAVAQTPTANDPNTATYLDNQQHTIPGNGAQWYRFNYGGGGSEITVTLLNGAGGNLQFNVFTPAQVGDWTNTVPVGRGTVLATNCNSGLPAPGGGCEGNDLVWGGKFRDGGTYYVQVVNQSPAPQTFVLTVAGEDVAQCVQAGAANPNPAAPQCAPAASGPTAAATQNGAQVITPTLTITRTATIPAPTASPVVSMTVAATSAATGAAAVDPLDTSAPNTFYTDPYHALPLNGESRTLPGNASIWYRFEYTGDASPITLRMENGAVNGLRFDLYLPEQAPDWSLESPIGRGTGSSCAAEAVDPGTCGENANALLWSGKFQSGGTYFVRVTNPTPNPVQFALTVTGPGISVCGPAGGTLGQGPDFFPCPAAESTPAGSTTPSPTSPTGPTLTPRPPATETPAG